MINGKKIEQEFNEILMELSSDGKLNQMKAFIQHGKVNTYDHVIDVARASFLVHRGLRKKSDPRALVRAALLHDYFLYDWHDVSHSGVHFVSHPAHAAKNAKADFGLTKKEERAIRSHMFPAGLRPPTSREALILTCADKFCATREFFLSKRQK